jgi:hypothetical protein
MFDNYVLKKAPSIMLTFLLFAISFFTFPIYNKGPAVITVPDDISTINGAVTLVSSGGTVRIKRGTYTESVYINKSITLLGEDNPTIIGPLNVANAQNVSVKSITFIIDPPGTEPAITVTDTSNMALENLNIKWSGILLTNASNLHVRSCLFTENPGPAISIRGKASKNITIEWCNFNQIYSALSVRQASQITFKFNIVNATEAAIKLFSECRNATIYLNNLLNGLAEDDGLNNKWYNETLKLGNYWGKKDDEKDANGDGIIDEPKIINGAAHSMDEYPLAKPFQEYLKSQNQQTGAMAIIIFAIVGVVAATAATILFYRKRRGKVEQK